MNVAVEAPAAPAVVAGDPVPSTPGQTTAVPAPAAAPAPAPAAAAEPGDLLSGATPTITRTPFDATTFTFPDGLEVTDDHKSFLAKVAQDYEIPAEAMSALVGRYADETKAIADGLGVQVEEAWNETVNGFKTETETHYGDKLSDVLVKARGALDEYGGAEALEALQLAGLGNNLAIIKMLEKFADAVGEGRPVTAHGTPQTGHPLAATYPSMFPENKR